MFRTHGSVNFSDYLTYVRIDRAKFLLKIYKLGVEEMAWQCGYRDAGYFCRVFKRSPGDYRRSVVVPIDARNLNSRSKSD